MYILTFQPAYSYLVFNIENWSYTLKFNISWILSAIYRSDRKGCYPNGLPFMGNESKQIKKILNINSGYDTERFF